MASMEGTGWLAQAGGLLTSLALPLPSCGTLSKPLHLSGPQLPDLQSEGWAQMIPKDPASTGGGSSLEGPQGPASLPARGHPLLTHLPSAVP